MARGLQSRPVGSARDFQRAQQACIPHPRSSAIESDRVALCARDPLPYLLRHGEMAPPAGALGPAPAVPIEKVLKLFTGANSQQLYDRHMSALDRLCKANASGFAIKDLPQIQQLLELTLGLISVKGMADFVQPAVTLIK